MSACSPTQNRNALRRSAAVVLSLLLTACASQQGVDLPDIVDWESRQGILGELDQWQFSGRIAVNAHDDGFNGKLRWLQDADKFSATLSGPLGVGTVRIEGAGDSVQITGKDGVTTVLRDVEAELYYRYGWTIPVQSLRYWVLGIPDPRVPSQTEFDELDRVRHMRQRGWEVDIDRYREAGGQQMPARLVATSNETKVRIIIDKWIFREIVASP